VELQVRRKAPRLALAKFQLLNVKLLLEALCQLILAISFEHA
jgi:hypothetical protein